MFANFQKELFRASISRTDLESGKLKKRCALSFSDWMVHRSRQMVFAYPHCLSLWNVLRCFHLILHSFMENFVSMLDHIPLAMGSL